MNSLYRKPILGDMADRPFSSVLEHSTRDGGSVLTDMFVSGHTSEKFPELHRVKDQWKHRIQARRANGTTKQQTVHTTLPPRRMLIVGASEKGTLLARELTVNFPADYAVVGFVDEARSEVVAAPENILGSRQEIAQLVQSHEIDEVVVADCLTESIEANKQLANPALPGTELPKAVSSPLNRGLKRAFDITVSLMALLVGLPMMAIIAIGTKLTSPGPIFYNQKRVGEGGQEFTIYKFRSMHVDAETASGPVLSRTDDERTTLMGKIMRATHADEWPQFYNVLRGDMSIVGPRPERMCFVEKYNRYIPAYSQRHLVKPGITGLAQVNAGYLTHAYVKLHYDLMYVYNHSVWSDICILAKTPVSIIQTMRRREI